MTNNPNLAPLANAYAAAKAQQETADNLVEKLRKEIIELGYDQIESDTLIVQISLTERQNFDTAKAKTFLTADQIKACTKKPTVSERLTIKAKVPVAA